MDADAVTGLVELRAKLVDSYPRCSILHGAELSRAGGAESVSFPDARLELIPFLSAQTRVVHAPDQRPHTLVSVSAPLDGYFRPPSTLHPRARQASNFSADRKADSFRA